MAARPFAGQSETSSDCASVGDGFAGGPFVGGQERNPYVKAGNKPISHERKVQLMQLASDMTAQVEQDVQPHELPLFRQLFDLLLSERRY